MTVDPMRMVWRFLATAQRNGADLRPFTEVTAFVCLGRTVTGVMAHDYLLERDYELGAYIVVIAAGPWAGRVGELAGVSVPMRPSPASSGTIGRFCDKILNHLHKSGDGDIIVPQRRESVVGDDLVGGRGPRWPAGARGPRRDDVSRGREAYPGRGVSDAAGGVVGRTPAGRRGRRGDRPRVVPHVPMLRPQAARWRGGPGHNHRGKATTLRAMAPAAADVVCSKLGIAGGLPHDGGGALAAHGLLRPAR